MAAVPKRRISTRRGGKRWRSRLQAAKKSLQNKNLTKNKHLRKLSANQ